MGVKALQYGHASSLQAMISFGLMLTGAIVVAFRHALAKQAFPHRLDPLGDGVDISRFERGYLLGGALAFGIGLVGALFGWG